MSLQQLQQKLPKVREWTDRTLAAHSGQARPVAELGFTRLGSYFSPALLTSARAIPVATVPRPPLASMGLAGFDEFENLDADGITYLNSFFVRHGHERDESLHFHELVHVVQWQHLGPDQFIMAYALGHSLCGGYDTNPLEVMAYVMQTCFDQQVRGFDVAAIVRVELDRVVPALFARAQAAER